MQFRVPAIRCIACVWLLENLPRLSPAVQHSQVNFARKEVSIQFSNEQLKLSEIVALLASLGYSPELKLADLERKESPIARRLWLQLGVAGFAFANIMLFSLPGYFGLDSFSGPTFNKLFGWFSLVLAAPVLVFSAQDYWRAAWFSLKQIWLAIEVPIAIGLAVLFIQSALEVFRGIGPGYFDSLTGLIFFLLIGRIFQQKTYDRLSFERDYRSFFPLAVTRIDKGEQRVSLSLLKPGDRLLIRNGELIPADARLLSGPALIDYSFVTGESDPVSQKSADLIYAGGRQMGGAIQVELIKPVRQSYLTSLWNQDAFQKDKARSLDTLVNRYSHKFTLVVVAVAVSTAAWWMLAGETSTAIKAFTSVLIVACPCALALALPFTLGTALRVLGRREIFLKGTGVIEDLSEIDTVVFDKTGTLTESGRGAVKFVGEKLTLDEQRWLFSLARHSTHPYSVRISEAIENGHYPDDVRSYVETSGKGIEGRVAGHEIWMGSSAWLAERNACRQAPQPRESNASEVHVAIDGRYRGHFCLDAELRNDIRSMVSELSGDRELVLLSGDNERERPRFESIFGKHADLRFQQSPLDKLEFVHSRQRNGSRVAMVGDGLNDAGALKQANVGLAVVEEAGAFSPASDGILNAAQISNLHGVFKYSRSAMRIVKVGFGISALYNIAGVTVAAMGMLSPIVCAILMPVSSITVVVFSTGMATWMGQNLGSVNTEVRR